MSTVSLGEVVTVAGVQKRRRVKILNEEQKAAISSMQSSNDIPREDRCMCWNAFYRRLKETSTLPEGLLNKWKDTSTTKAKSDAQTFLRISLTPGLSS